MRIACDLDDVLCQRPPGLEHLGPDKYLYCEPIVENISMLNDLYYQGNEIIIYTARGMDYYLEDLSQIYNNLYLLTKSQLDSWNVKYHSIILGKIKYDLFIDDKALNSLGEAWIQTTFQNFMSDQ